MLSDLICIYIAIMADEHFAPQIILLFGTVQSVCNYFFSYFKNFLFCYQIFKSCFFLSLTRYCCVVDSFSVYLCYHSLDLITQTTSKKSQIYCGLAAFGYMYFDTIYNSVYSNLLRRKTPAVERQNNKKNMI